MKIDEGSANKTTRINKQFSIIIILALVIFMISGSAATMSYAAPQTLPSCTDPTGQNLRCMMVISTLPPPPNALQCQETSGQILLCSYTTQNLSNGEQIVAITVYVPASYVFTGYGPWTIVKQVVHETKTRIVHAPECPKGQRLDPKIHKCVDISYCPPPKGYHIDSITHKCVPDHCQPGQVYNPITGKCETLKCERPDAGAITDLDKNLKTKDCDLGDANGHGITPTPSPPTCKDNTTCPYVNTTKSLASAVIQPSNTSIPASGGPGAGSTCPAGNCTTGTPPPLTTKTCPDGSVIDASATCPTPSTIPNTPPPPSSSTPPPPPPSNNPSPPSDNGNPSGGSGSSNGGGTSGGGSSPPQPSTLS